METQTHSIELLVERAEQYGKTTVELYKLRTIERSAEVISSVVTKLIIVASFSLFFLILNIGLALWLGELLGKAYYGFLCVAMSYAIIGLVLFAFRNKWIETPLRNSIINKALN